MPAPVAQSFSDGVDLICQGFRTLTDLLGPNLSAGDFHALEKPITQLTEALTAHSIVTTTIAYLADKHHSGDRVGSRTPDSYIATLLGISPFEARRLVQRGRDTFTPPRLADIRHDLSTVTEDDDTLNLGNQQEETAEQRAARLEKERARFVQAQQIRTKQKEAQQKAAEAFQHNRISEEYLRILDRELSRLQTNLNRHSIRAQALTKAAGMSAKDFRYLVRKLVEQENARHHDPEAAYKKRFLKIGTPDADGGAQLTGYLPASSLALFQEALSSSNQPDKSTTSGEQPRTLQQRRLDELVRILRKKSAYTAHNRGGIGTLVVSMTTQELSDVLTENNAVRLIDLLNQPRPTNTAAMVSLLELYNMGLATYDMVCLHDPHSGNPLFCGKAKRSATLTQRIALIASELVCSYPGCDVPACNCDVHHIKAWNQDGRTDIDNLTLRCRNHHMDNNDAHDPKIPRGWADRDPDTGRAGHQPPPTPGTTALPPIEINRGYKSQQSAGWKLRQEHSNEISERYRPDRPGGRDRESTATSRTRTPVNNGSEAGIDSS